jgi:hypothetical protein
MKLPVPQRAINEEKKSSSWTTVVKGLICLEVNC